MTRRRRKRAAPELPKDDGLTAVVRWVPTPWGLRVRHELIGPVEAKRYNEKIRMAMGQHDSRSRRERWGGNQWGEGWVTKPAKRSELEAQAPLLRTDLTLLQWRLVAA